jgi:heme exporter protein D
MIPFSSRRSSSAAAVACILIGAGYAAIVLLDPGSSALDAQGLWTSFAVSILPVLVLGIDSYEKDRKKYSRKQLRRARATAHSRTRPRVAAIAGASVIVLTAQIITYSIRPVMSGFFTGLMVWIGVLILLDNGLRLGIFVWNSRDPRMRNLFGHAAHQR